MVLWQDIAAVLREAIDRGDYQPGATIPKETELMAAHRVGRETVRRAVMQLTAEGRLEPAPFVLRDVVGLSYNEIAETLEISLATTKWRIYKAREFAAARLVEEGVLRRPIAIGVAETAPPPLA